MVTLLNLWTWFLHILISWCWIQWYCLLLKAAWHVSLLSCDYNELCNVTEPIVPFFLMQKSVTWMVACFSSIPTDASTPSSIPHSSIGLKTHYLLGYNSLCAVYWVLKLNSNTCICPYKRQHYLRLTDQYNYVFEFNWRT